MQNRMKTYLLCIALVVFAVTAARGQDTKPATAPTTDTPDYSKAANWVCRPGAEEICTTGLDAMVVGANGKRLVQHFEAAKNPLIDCFYVYPTVSQEQAPYSDMADSQEIQHVVKAHAGRLTSRCRVFAPLYRQVTLYQMYRSFAGASAMDFNPPLQDVEAAWDYYLKHDNQGRGVVLIGHSQGTIVLQQLIAELIDGKQAQALLVSAVLAGDPSLGVPPGKAVGGIFKHIAVCSAAAETGCAYAWGTFLADDVSPNHYFGKVRNDGLASACANPAAPGGGTGKLKFYYEKPSTAAANDPPWIEAIDQVSGECHADSRGNDFRVTVNAGPWAEQTRALLKRAELRAGWGMHLLDMTLVQGNILDVLDAESAAWRKVH